MDILFPIARWLSSPEIVSKMIFEPKECIKNGERYYEEFTDSDHAINLYKDLPVLADGKKPLIVYIVLGLDGTPLSSTGDYIFIDDLIIGISTTPIVVYNGN